MSQENLKYWLALSKIPGLGPARIKNLYEHFGSTRKIWEASTSELFQIEGIGKVIALRIAAERKRINPDKEIESLPKNVDILTLDDPVYPSNLKNIYDPPSVLYIKGKLVSEDKNAIAIVGTRKASSYGQEVAKKIAGDLASAGLTVVSGLALGIDTAAHEGALGVKGRTLAVLGSGVDVIYPLQNQNLAQKIINSGALISEFPLGTEPETGHFPRRNRIISGLSLGVAVIEGTQDSGALITAKSALDQGREVFAIPGRIGYELSKGPHSLIKQGAKLVEGVEDILEELKFVLPKKEAKPFEREYGDLNPEEKKIVKLLSLEPKHIDDLASTLGISSAQVAGLLTILEVKKIVKQLPGKIFSLGN